MTTDEALKILEEVTGQINATRQIHDAITTALNVLKLATQTRETKTNQEG